MQSTEKIYCRPEIAVNLSYGGDAIVMSGEGVIDFDKNWLEEQGGAGNE